MATAALVDKDIETGRQIVASLTEAEIPVTVYLWAFVSEQWLFIVATPLIDLKGPLAAYAEVNRALQRAGMPGEIARQRIFMMSPNDPELKVLEKQSKAAPYEAIRTVNASIAGRFVEDAYVYSGSIRIGQLGNSGGATPNRYSLIYVPYSKPRGAPPYLPFEDLESVGQFLLEKLHIDNTVVEAALKEVPTKRSTLIPNVQLSHAELKRLGLA